jgi:creatinine amidohydrolase
MRPYILTETNWKNVKDTDFDLAVLPWGATEAHNFHLPYGTDNIEADSLAAEAAGIAWEKGAKVIVLPTVPFGVNTGQRDIKLDINIYPSTQMAILSDIVETLDRQGIRKLIVFNSHGGNAFQPVIREVGARYPQMLIMLCNWYQWAGKKRFFEQEGDHADEMETSLIMYLKPELVLPLSEAGEGRARKRRLEALNEGWCWMERNWPLLTDDTGVGNPKKADREKGEKFFFAMAEEIAKIFLFLSKNNLNDFYER